MSTVRFTPVPGGLALESPFNRDLVDDLKARVKYQDRKWDPSSKRWIIAPEAGLLVAGLVSKHLGVTVEVPDSVLAAPTPQLRMVQLDYLGRVQERPDGSRTATGFAEGSWSLIFPEAVLKAWFQAETTPDTPREPDAPQTLYEVLALKNGATPEEIKAGYRRMALQWHPDRCSEPDAKERFQRIVQAYEVLKEPQKRKKYDAGLALEASLKTSRPKNMAIHRHDEDVYGFRSPLRCGLLLLEGTVAVGRTTVSTILKWSDVVRADGKTMVSSWPAGADTFHVGWF